MRRMLFVFLHAATAAVFLAPILWAMNRRWFRNGKRTLCYFLFAFYLCGMYAVVGLPNIRYMRLDFNINLKPFAYMFSDYQNSLLNVLLFLPLGFFLPVLWDSFKKGYWTVLFGMCTSLLIELLQLLTFRATDINDLMTNTVGTFLGWLLGRTALRFIPGLSPQKNTQEVYAVCAVTFGVMFFLQPFLGGPLELLLSRCHIL